MSLGITRYQIFSSSSVTGSNGSETTQDTRICCCFRSCWGKNSPSPSMTPLPESETSNETSETSNETEVVTSFDDLICLVNAISLQKNVDLLIVPLELLLDVSLLLVGSVWRQLNGQQDINNQQKKDLCTLFAFFEENDDKDENIKKIRKTLTYWSGSHSFSNESSVMDQTQRNNLSPLLFGFMFDYFLSKEATYPVDISSATRELIATKDVSAISQALKKIHEELSSQENTFILELDNILGTAKID